MVSRHCKHAPRRLEMASHPCSPWFAQPPASPWLPKRLPTLEPLLTFDLLFALTSPHAKAPRPKGCSFRAIESMRCDGQLTYAFHPPAARYRARDRSPISGVLIESVDGGHIAVLSAGRSNV